MDTSIWIGHLRRTDSRLVGLLEAGEVLMHPIDVHLLAAALLGRDVRVWTDDARLAAAARRLFVAA